jgi:WD40 repeat protein
LRSQALAFTREGNRLVQARAKSLFIHDVETGAQVGTFSDHKLVVTALAMSQDGKTVASSDFGGTIFLWDPLLVKTQRAIQLSPPPGQNGRRAVDIIDQVLFAADGRHLLIRKREGTVLILRLAPPRASDKNGAGQ